MLNGVAGSIYANQYFRTPSSIMWAWRKKNEVYLNGGTPLHRFTHRNSVPHAKRAVLPYVSFATLPSEGLSIVGDLTPVRL